MFLIPGGDGLGVGGKGTSVTSIIVRLKIGSLGVTLIFLGGGKTYVAFLIKEYLMCDVRYLMEL